MKNKRIKRIFSILMSFALVFSMIPTTVLAWDEDDTCEFCSREIHDDWICEHGGHCSSETDDSCYEDHHCEDCGEATDEKCDNCGRCADCEMDVYCPECNECTGEELCPYCGLCESCMGFYSCEDCGNCNPDEFCDGCGFCEDCATHCIECGACNGGEICEDCQKCGDCALHCKECGFCEYETDICSEECGLCYDCGGTCSEGQEHACLECHDGASACDECGKCFGSDEHIDGVERCMECGLCSDCMDGYKCQLCGICGNCRELCERCGGDSCVVCHEEEGIDEMAPCPDCGYCKTGMDYCTVCGICEECGDVCPDCDACFSCGDGYHCPDCDTCFEVARRCDQDGDHCVICCEENGWLCSECGECIEPKGDIGICRDCGACNDCNEFCDTCGENDLCVDCCVEEESLHCPECRGCYEGNGTAPCADCDICSDCADICESCERCIDCTIADGSHCEDCEKCLIDDYLECELCGELICSDCVGYCEECQACLTCCYEEDYHCVECEECCNFYFGDPRWVGLCNECGRCQNCLGNENWCANCGGCNECMTKHPDNAVHYWHCTGCYICGSEVEEPFCETCHQCENCCICNASFTVTVNYESGGMASADATTVKYKNNVVLSATPDPGYQFKCWEVVSGGVEIVNDTFTMPGNNVTVKAIFVPLVAVHPEDVTVEEGQKAVFKASCESVLVDYYWEYSLPGVEAWSYANFAEGFMTDTMTVDATLAMNGYKFRCVLLDGQGDRTYSDVAVLTVTEKPVVKLDAPKNVKLTTVTSTGYPKLTWDKVEGAEKYEVWRKVGSGGTYKKQYTTTGTSYTNSSATAGTVYYYKVKAIHSNEECNSAFSAEKSIACDLAQPGGVKLTTVTSTGYPKLTWDKVDGADEYEVWRKVGSSGTYKKQYTTTGSSYTNSSAIAGTVYYYKVKAICGKNSGGNSAFSAEKSIVCDLAQPKNLKVTTVASSGKPKVTWSKVEGATKYEVWRKVGSSGTYAKFYTTTGTSMTNTSATAGKVYYYKVKAICGKNSGGNSVFSASDYVTCDLAAPKITVSGTKKPGKIVVSWSKVTGADRYYIYRSTSKDGTYNKYSSTTSTTWTNTSVTKGKTYYYKVKAIYDSKSAANSAYSNMDYAYVR